MHFLVARVLIGHLLEDWSRFKCWALLLFNIRRLEATLIGARRRIIIFLFFTDLAHLSTRVVTTCLCHFSTTHSITVMMMLSERLVGNPTTWQSIWMLQIKTDLTRAVTILAHNIIRLDHTRWEVISFGMLVALLLFVFVDSYRYLDQLEVSWIARLGDKRVILTVALIWLQYSRRILNISPISWRPNDTLNLIVWHDLDFQLCADILLRLCAVKYCNRGRLMALLSKRLRVWRDRLLGPTRA